jgi:indole-3-glycerol phosphate synthase
MNFLENILREKREEIVLRKRTVPLNALRDRPFYSRKSCSLVEALKEKTLAVIAEVKKASPSKGVLRVDFDPVTIAKEYAAAGASGLSMLTDEKYFQGKVESLEAIRSVVDLPILRKDFILDPYQLHEARSAGADAVLLIVAALERNQLFDLHSQASALGLESLLEVHTEREIEALDGLPCSMVGINNRDLVSFDTDLGVSVRLRPMIPHEALCVSESGIGNAQDLATLARAGIHAVLVGEKFMRAPSPGKALSDFLREGWAALA